MNKKVINTAAVTVQNSNEQKQKTKTLIVNLGAATQLTLGGVGGGGESTMYRYFNAQT